MRKNTVKHCKVIKHCPHTHYLGHCCKNILFTSDFCGYYCMIVYGYYTRIYIFYFTSIQSILDDITEGGWLFFCFFNLIFKFYLTFLYLIKEKSSLMGVEMWMHAQYKTRWRSLSFLPEFMPWV